MRAQVSIYRQETFKDHCEYLSRWLPFEALSKYTPRASANTPSLPCHGLLQLPPLHHKNVKNCFLFCWDCFPDGPLSFPPRMYDFVMSALMFTSILGVFLLSFVLIISNFSLSFLSSRDSLPFPPVPAPQANRIAGTLFLDEYLETSNVYMNNWNPRNRTEIHNNSFAHHQE